MRSPRQWLRSVFSVARGRTYILPTWQGAALAVLVGITALVGGVTGNDELLVLSFGLLTVGIITLFITNGNIGGLSIERRTPIQVQQEGSSAVVALSLKNGSREERLGIRVEAGQGSSVVPLIRANGTVDTTFTFTPQQPGEIPLPPIRLETTYPTNLCYAWMVCQPNHAVPISPSPIGSPPPAKNDIREGDEDLADPDDLAPYSAGQPVARIDWKVYARLRQLRIRNQKSVKTAKPICLDWSDTVGLPLTRLRQLAAWLEKAIRDQQPFKLVLPGTSRIEEPNQAREALARFSSVQLPPEEPARLAPKRARTSSHSNTLDTVRKLLLALNILLHALLPGAWNIYSLIALSLGFGVLALRFTPNRANFSIFCALASTACAGGVSIEAAIFDPLVAFFLSSEMNRPQGVRAFSWSRLSSLLKVAIPAAAIITVIYLAFSNSLTARARVGFDPGRITPDTFSQLHRRGGTAFEASFRSMIPPQVVPPYWKCDQLMENRGLRWQRGRNTLLTDPQGLQHPPLNVPYIEYDLIKLPHSEIPMLGIPSQEMAARSTLIDQSGLARSTDMSETATVRSYLATSSTPPTEDALQVKPSSELDQIASDLLSNSEGTVGGLIKALESYYRRSGFKYSLTPERPADPSLEFFLNQGRVGYCGHYAAASADLLRRAGVPARVVTGYLGGKWNPWLKRFTVSHDNAHAWVEAWNGRYWQHFDPTMAVAPGVIEQQAYLANPGAWGWSKHLWENSRATQIFLSESLAYVLPRLTIPSLLVGLLIFGIILVFREFRRRLSPVHQLAAIETRAQRSKLPRGRGETPLAFLTRLATTAAFAREANDLKALAAKYQRSIYAPNNKKSPYETHPHT